MQAERAEREGDYGKVAEIRYGKVKEQEEMIADAHQATCMQVRREDDY